MLRSLARIWLYRSGGLGLYHRLRNRRQLTIVMFHRVLPETDPRSPEADPAWTVSPGVFEQCLDFFRDHYNVISLDDLLSACENRSRLPDRALLITFDDGWADNEEYALPLLEKRRLPAVLFVVAEGIGQTQLWREAMFRAWRHGRLHNRECARLWHAAGSGSPPPHWTKQTLWSLINCLAGLDTERREALLLPFLAPGARAELLSRGQLSRLRSSGMDIGSHTLTHTPLIWAPDPNEELRASRQILADLPPSGKLGPIAFSFPHGLYDSSSIRAARAAGYRLLFTSDATLNSVNDHACGGGVFGRIPIEAGAIQDQHGRVRPELLALWLFPRSHHAVSFS